MAASLPEHVRFRDCRGSSGAAASGAARRERRPLEPLPRGGREPFRPDDDSLGGGPGVMARPTIARGGDAPRAAAGPMFASLQAELDRLVPTADDAALDAFAI